MGEGMVERYSERRSEAAAELDFDRIPHPSDVNLRWAIATIAGLEMPHWLLHQMAARIAHRVFVDGDTKL